MFVEEEVRCIIGGMDRLLQLVVTGATFGVNELVVRAARILTISEIYACKVLQPL